MRFIKPLDEEMLNYISSKFNKVITLEENTIVGGFGSAVLEFFADNNYKNDLMRIGIPDQFVDHGTQSELHKEIEIDPDSIIKRIKTFCNISGIHKEVIA